MKPIYRATQNNNSVLVAFSLVQILVVLMIFVTGWWIPLSLAFLLLSASLLVFHSLSVQVYADHLKLYFGVGWPRRIIQLAEIRDVCIVQHMPGEGWGIHTFDNGNGRLYRISGNELLELELTEGRTVRISTDDPHTLATVIEDALIDRRRR